MNKAVATVGVWVPSSDGPPALSPTERPIGRAAIRLSRDGVRVIFGDRMTAGQMSGFEVVGERWRPCTNVYIDAIHDRFPSQIRAVAFQALLSGRTNQPMGNPPGFTALCRDKIASQEALTSLGVPMPEIETDPARFQARLAEWGAGFIKPRFGSLGAGVARVMPGDHLTFTRPGVVPGREEPAILQRAINPPKGLAGLAVRVLVQRTRSGWHIETPVVRSSASDPVANAARGAAVAAGPDVLRPQVLNRIRQSATHVCQLFERLECAEFAVEAGLDLVIDPRGIPHLIEVNARPRGRLEVLAQSDPDRFQDAHEAACARPLQTLAYWAIAGRHPRSRDRDLPQSSLVPVFVYR